MHQDVVHFEDPRPVDHEVAIDEFLLPPIEGQVVVAVVVHPDVGGAGRDGDELFVAN
jgi:hypothetical protein